MLSIPSAPMARPAKYVLLCSCPRALAEKPARQTGAWGLGVCSSDSPLHTRPRMGLACASQLQEVVI